MTSSLTKEIPLSDIPQALKEGPVVARLGDVEHDVREGSGLLFVRAGEPYQIIYADMLVALGFRFFTVQTEERKVTLRQEIQTIVDKAPIDSHTRRWLEQALSLPDTSSVPESKPELGTVAGSDDSRGLQVTADGNAGDQDEAMGRVVATARRFVECCNEFYPEYPGAVEGSLGDLIDAIDATGDGPPSRKSEDFYTMFRIARRIAGCSPNWASIGSINNTAQPQISREDWESLCWIVRRSEEHFATSRQAEVQPPASTANPSSSPKSEIGEPEGKGRVFEREVLRRDDGGLIHLYAPLDLLNMDPENRIGHGSTVYVLNSPAMEDVRRLVEAADNANRRYYSEPLREALEALDWLPEGRRSC